MNGVSIYLDDDEYYTLKRITMTLGESMSGYARKKLRQAIIEDKAKLEDSNFNIFDYSTVMKVLNVEEVEQELKKGKWNIPQTDETNKIMARAIAYAQKKYGVKRTREIGIFATIIAGFTTGLWGGFGQDQDPLYLEAQKAVIELAGGRVVGDVGFIPVTPVIDKALFTETGIRKLEEILFKNNIQGGC